VTDRHVPEPPPGPTPDEVADTRAMAIAAREAGEAFRRFDEAANTRAMAIAAREAGQALRRFVDLARLAGQSLGGAVDDLDQLAEDCKGWALGFAMGAGATDLVEQWTGRPWRQL
jgi:hypothetical protein